jgi:hypothetical protein
MASYEQSGAKGYMEAAVLARTFIHLTSTLIVLAVAVMLGLPFFLALAWPFLGR